MLMAYLDESGNDGVSPAMCVAGFLFEKNDARALDREWKKALDIAGIKCFHTVDYSHSKGEFAGRNRQEMDGLYRRLIAIIKKYACGGAVVYTVRESKFDAVMQDCWDYSQYTTAANTCMHLLFKIAKDLGHGGVHYRIENGHENMGELRTLASKMFEQKLYSGSWQFGSKTTWRPLQTADIFAYESTKRVRDPEREMRKSLRELITDAKNQKMLIINEQRLRQLSESMFEGLVNQAAGRPLIPEIWFDV